VRLDVTVQHPGRHELLHPVSDVQEHCSYLAGAQPVGLGYPVGETVVRQRHHQQQLAVQVSVVQHRDQVRALRVPELPGDLDLALGQPRFGSAPPAGIQPDAHLLDRDCAAFAVLAAEDLGQRAALSQTVRRIVAVLAPLIAAEAPHRRLGHGGFRGGLAHEQFEPLRHGPEREPDALDL
jgi:hypothetical protein